MHFHMALLGTKGKTPENRSFFLSLSCHNEYADVQKTVGNSLNYQLLTKRIVAKYWTLLCIIPIILPLGKANLTIMHNIGAILIVFLSLHLVFIE